ncbi:MAG: hypothetical protein A2268_14245 [Candidatus Raymondbacteria bacterium RifOxyA12_full_50_37]|uniref:Flagellin n=1 Tax=Candidatus Raymondbacteria bacterium RIFOXYD12_FULL_49_13 TaxID=1817890 RepID=A0A1F7FKP6_UNCRA|nr:MAG: hypothetical protein A2268_14245 [Candidatus Raymondbacteria bacterium RifOxyA12_full_50_37]OGJ86920.1 MAG: hypothetical protein A2350_02155 [Candidatus Raymondbacteria bacterium RifOxyB12_full_50_8]OGJ88240.1 MAG: hypothetical protein A2248_19585 [Candidatus Raymondbacteria bacterium RIFOXYA2_FULL_49_16]OGJ97107.1 MAG: hypothetical protein A2487_05895 [Candidatus Raymondbacteria bacterium RifOxyC12_full_50_8]OGK07285.1 MAG: hypothetical protein A2519_14255 [Candidatus Raymondbacteria b
MQIDKAQTIGLIGAAQKSNKNLSKIQERLATALRINRASDDAAGLSISEQMRTQIRGFQMANVNVEYAEAAQYIAEGEGNETASMLQRQRELAVQSSNGTLTARDREALNVEYQQINQELTRQANATQFNMQDLTNGTGLAAGGTVLAGPNPGSDLPVEGADFTAANLGVAATDISSPANASNAINAIDTAIQNVSGQRTNLGANINRLGYARDLNDNQAAMTQDAESRIRDQDFAAGIVEEAKQRLLNQTAMAAMKNFRDVNKNSMMALLA